MCVAHNASFERRWLGEAGVEAEWADSMALFSESVGGDGPNPPRGNTMEDMVTWSGQEYRDAHRAPADTAMMVPAVARVLELADLDGE